MKLLTKQYIENLKSKESDYNVSIFIPTYIANKDDQNKIGFKNALKEVKSKLTDQGIDEQKIENLLKSINAIQEKPDFWKYQSKGLVIFANESVVDFAQVPKRVKPFTYIGNEFYFRPILTFLEDDFYAYLMTVSPSKIRLFTVSTYEITEHDISNEFPKNIDESHWFTDRHKTLQGHNSGRTVFHGQGGGKDTKDEDMKRFFRDVYTGLEDFFKGKKQPLILAGVEETVQLFKQSFHYTNIHKTHIQGSHDETPYTELYNSAEEILREDRIENISDELDNINEIKHFDKVTKSLEKIVSSSLNGEINTLYITNDKLTWGYIDKKNNSLVLEKEKNNGQVDIINTIAIQTILHGGCVKIIKDEKLKTKINSEVLAKLRF